MFSVTCRAERAPGMMAETVEGAAANCRAAVRRSVPYPFCHHTHSVALGLEALRHFTLVIVAVHAGEKAGIKRRAGDDRDASLVAGREQAIERTLVMHQRVFSRRQKYVGSPASRVRGIGLMVLTPKPQRLSLKANIRPATNSRRMATAIFLQARMSGAHS